MKTLMKTSLSSIFALAMSVLFVIACQDVAPASSSLPKTKSIDYSINEPYSFDAITQKEVWSTFHCFEEKMEACQVPDELLSNMTTEALMMTCLNHPLALSYTAYNDERDGVNVICQMSNAFQELLRRSDGINQLVQYYSSYPEVVVWETGFKTTKEVVSITTLSFIELLIANNLSKVDGQLKLEVLAPAVFGWKERKEANKQLFSEYSICKTRYLADRVSPTKVSGGDIIGTAYFQTPYGQGVMGYYLSEMTPSEVQSSNAYYIQHYPNASYEGPSTWSYNCHSYAWNISNGGIYCWIVYDSTCNLSSYWTNDYFCSTNYPGSGSRVLYYNSDHSAVMNSQNNYTSKWGSGPLMSHAPGDGPYANMNQRWYYRPAYVLDVLDGNDLTSVGVTNYYYTDIQDNSRFTYSWTVERANGSQTGFSATPNGYSNAVVFNQMGLFNVTCDVYYQGSYVGSQWLEVAVE